MKINYRPEIGWTKSNCCWCCNSISCSNQIFGKYPFQGGFIGVDIFCYIRLSYYIYNFKRIYKYGIFFFKYFMKEELEE